jgi:hypothetical protein
MNFINHMTSRLMSDDWQQFALKTGIGTVLAGVCGYGGTFFFTKLNPMMGASYIASVALIGLIAYEALEQIKTAIDSPLLKNSVTAVQLLQIPVFFYVLHGTHSHLSAAIKFEIIAATVYFTAIPLFFHLAIVAWKDQTSSNIGAAVGVMLSLASGLRNYAMAI